jgi:hypothetical protein
MGALQNTDGRSAIFPFQNDTAVSLFRTIPFLVRNFRDTFPAHCLSRPGVGELFHLLPQNIFIYVDVTPMISKGENNRLFKFKRFVEYIYMENTIINIKSIKYIRYNQLIL